MTAASKRTDDAPSRVARHRRRQSAAGAQRVEVTVPRNDAGLVRALADILRAGGTAAERLRERLRPLVADDRARTGGDLVAFFRNSPVADEDLAFERDHSPGRPVVLGP